MGIAANVYDGTSPATLVGALTSAFDRGWRDQLNDVGSGMVSVHVDDSDLLATPALKRYDNIVRFSLDGIDRFAFIVEKRDIPPAPPGEKADHSWKLSGRGVLALLEDAIVFPEAYVDGSLIRQRHFDWTAIVYDDSGWIAATQVQRQDATGGTVPDWNTYPAEWPDPLAYWIWSRTMVPASNPDGISYFRKDFTLAAATNVFLYVTCDNGYRLWIDNEVKSEDWPGNAGFGWRETRTAEFLLGPGTHQIAVEAVNYDLGWASGGVDSPAGLLVSIITNNNGVPGAVLVRSDNTWVCLDYPASVPGMSTGEILRILIAEAQTRGALEGITLGFTDTTDSNGAAWAEQPDIALDVGTDLLNVIRTFVEQFVDVRMSPTLTLNVYNKGTLGSDKTGSVTLAVGVDFVEESTQGETLKTNSILARDTLGQLTTEGEATSLVTYRRKEAYLELALAPNPARARAMSTQVFVEWAYPSVQMSGRVIAASGPYVDWQPGDLILGAGPSETLVATNILSLGIGEDEAGNPTFLLEGAQDDATT